MTIGEAQAVNDLIRFALRKQNRRPCSADQTARARAAAVLLADHAHKPLMAGLTGADVTTRWPEPTS